MTNREIDILVAEKVMGIKIVAYDWPCGFEPECGCYEASGTRPSDPLWKYKPGPVFAEVEDTWPPKKSMEFLGNNPVEIEVEMALCLHPVPFYSIDIAAAWQVVEKMSERGKITIDHFTDRSTSVEMWDRSKKEITDAGEATAPMAISLAALKSVGVEISTVDLEV